MDKLKIHRFILFITLVALLPVLTVVLTGCEGPAGSAGQDATIGDVEPPVIQLSFPTMYDTVGTVFTASAVATDAIGIDRVVFYIDGQTFIGDSLEAMDTLGTSNNLYEYEFNAAELGLDYGTHTFAARAYDNAGNTQQTPSILFDYLEVTYNVPIRLRNYIPESLDTAYVYMELPSDTTDNLFNVRFNPEKYCVLDSVNIHMGYGLDASFDSTWIRARVYKSDAVWPMGDSLASVISDTLLSGEKITIDFSDLATPLKFYGYEDFHVAVELIDSSSVKTDLPIKSKIVTAQPMPLNGNSGYFDADEGRFVIMQETYYSGDAETTLELMIDAWVRYQETPDE